MILVADYRFFQQYGASNTSVAIKLVRYVRGRGRGDVGHGGGDMEEEGGYREGSLP